VTLAILCPGQGTQHPGMLDLVETNAHAHRVLEDAASSLGADVRMWLREPDDIAHNVIAQPLICVSQLAIWRALRDALPAPSLFAGYSVGELAAYGCAGALDTPTLCRLAHARALAMDDALHGRLGGMMLVDGLARGDVERLCAGHDASVAITISASRSIVGGLASDLDAIAASARARGARIERLRVHTPSHTSLLDAAVAPFRMALEGSPIAAPRAPVLAGIDGSLVSTRAEAIAALSRQLARTVDWAGCTDTAYERGCRVFLELGPGSALSRMMRERFPDAHARSIEDFRSLEGVVQWTTARL
jgi:[acyl-carrier-protein] S-malonyltransferase